MRKLNQILLLSAGLAVAAAFSVPESAQAQNVTQVIPVAPGVNLVITSSGSVPPPFLMPMPDSAAAFQHAEQSLEAAQASMMQQIRMLQESMPSTAMPSVSQGAAAIVVTSFSDGHGTCTQRITYPTNGGTPLVHISATGGTCKMVGFTPSAITPANSLDPSSSAPIVPVQKPQLVVADAAG